MYPYTRIPVYPYIHIPVYPYTRISVYPYIRIPVYPYTRISIYPYTRIPVYPYTRIPVYPYTRIPVYPYTRISVYPYTRTRIPGTRVFYHAEVSLLIPRARCCNFRGSLLGTYYGTVENAGTGYTGIRIYGYSGIRVFGYTGIRIYGYTGIRVHGYSDIGYMDVSINFNLCLPSHNDEVSLLIPRARCCNFRGSLLGTYYCINKTQDAFLGYFVLGVISPSHF